VIDDNGPFGGTGRGGDVVADADFGDFDALGVELGQRPGLAGEIAGEEASDLRFGQVGIDGLHRRDDDFIAFAGFDVGNRHCRGGGRRRAEQRKQRDRDGGVSGEWT
jgi:hypothetical protein